MADQKEKIQPMRLYGIFISGSSDHGVWFDSVQHRQTGGRVEEASESSL